MPNCFGQPNSCMDCGKRKPLVGESFLCGVCQKEQLILIRSKADREIEPLPTILERVNELYEQGMKATQIAEELDIQKVEVYQIRAKHNKALKRA